MLKAWILALLLHIGPPEKLAALRLGGIVRLTKQAVEDYEQQCTSSGDTQMDTGTSSMGTGLRNGHLQGRKTAAKQSNSSANS